LPRVAPTTVPSDVAISTSSGSGLFHEENAGIPIPAPSPTEESTGAFVKTSGSGPIPTSRYCDQSPSAMSTFLASAAAGEPGRMELMLPPRARPTSSRISAARLASPPQRSSMTRSIMLSTKVTPQALMT